MEKFEGNFLTLFLFVSFAKLHYIDIIYLAMFLQYSSSLQRVVNVVNFVDFSLFPISCVEVHFRENACCFCRRCKYNSLIGRNHPRIKKLNI